MKYCTLSHHTFRLLGPHTCRLRLAASAKLSQVFSDEPAVTMPTMSCAEIVSNCMKASKPGRIVEAMLEMPLVRSPLCFGFIHTQTNASPQRSDKQQSRSIVTKTGARERSTGKDERTASQHLPKSQGTSRQTPANVAPKALAPSPSASSRPSAAVAPVATASTAPKAPSAASAPSRRQRATRKKVARLTTR